jgi:DNA-binding CsgD family transcriptional regulator
LNTINLCNDVSEISRQFFEKTTITVFDHVRLYKDGTRFSLCSNALWSNYLSKEVDSHDLIIERNKIKNLPKYILWQGSLDIYTASIFQVAREQFNIDHGFTLIEYNKEYADLYYFASSRDNHDIQNFYINNIDILESFVSCYKSKGECLIKLAEQKRTTPRIEHGYQEFPLSEEIIKFNKIKNTYFNSIDDKIKLPYIDTTFSQREIQCIKLLSKGFAAKKIAATLNLSHRTVENYIANIKSKLNISSKAQLVEIANMFNFIFF